MYLASPVHCQSVVYPYMLKYKNDIAYFKGEPYTGNVMGDMVIPYKDGLIHGKVVSGNNVITYNKGIIENLLVYSDSKKEIINFKNNNALKPIEKINIGIWFNNQVGDTIFNESNSSESDSSIVKFGLILYYKNKTIEFMELNDLILYSFTWFWKCGSSHNEVGIKGNKISHNIFKMQGCKNEFIDFRVKLSSNETTSIACNIQRVFFKNIPKPSE